MKSTAFVSSSNSWSAIPLNPDTSASLGKGSLSIKEFTRRADDDPNNASQQQGSTSFGGSMSRGHRRCAYVTEGLSTSDKDKQPGVMPFRTEILPEPFPCLVDTFDLTPRQRGCTPLLDRPLDPVVGTTFLQTELVGSSSFDEHAQMNLDSATWRQPSGETLDQNSRSVLLYQVQDMVQPDWETSFALVSTTRPTPPGYMVEPGSYSLTEGEEQEQALSAAVGGGAGVLQITGESPHRMILDDDPNAVECLHLEIQRLQTRIMSRLRDSAMQEVSV